MSAWHEDLYYCPEALHTDSAFTLTMAGMTYCDGSYRVVRTNSPFYLFEYILEGEGVVTEGAFTCAPRRGDIYILRQGGNHEYYASAKNPWTKIWFSVKGDLVVHLLQVYNLFGTIHLADIDALAYFEKMLSFLKYNQSGCETAKIPLVFHELLIHIATSIDSANNRSPQLALSMMNYLNSHVEEPVSLELMSKQFYKCSSQLIRIFKNEFHVTPYDYLLSRRIDTAKHLLHNTNYPIKEIALKLQFADEHYFSNFFKNKVGLSPSDYKKSSPVKYI